MHYTHCVFIHLKYLPNRIPYVIILTFHVFVFDMIYIMVSNFAHVRYKFGEIITDLFEVPFLLSNKYDLNVAIYNNCNYLVTFPYDLSAFAILRCLNSVR